MREVDTLAINRIAGAIGKVIALKTIAADPKLRTLDGLGTVAAVTTMAKRMVPELQEEAAAAYREVLLIQTELANADG